MHVNWWSVSGLCPDIIGVLGVAIIPRWAVNTGKGRMRFGGVTPELEGTALVLDWLSWGLIILGFALQVLGQFLR
jgi:hypothetical protein